MAKRRQTYERAKRKRNALRARKAEALLQSKAEAADAPKATASARTQRA